MRYRYHVYLDSGGGDYAELWGTHARHGGWSLAGTVATLAEARALQVRVAEADTNGGATRALVRDMRTHKWVRGRACNPRGSGREAVSMACFLADADSVEELGTIEGSLKMITVAGNPRFNVYDSVTGLPVACRFESGLLERVASALGKRVSVTGRVSYSRDGYPKRIQDIADFLVLPDDGILPTAADVLKTGLDLTGGLLIEEFTEKRRHGRT